MRARERNWRWLCACACAVAALTACGGGDADQQAQDPFRNNSNPNAELGPRDSVLFWTPSQQQASYPNMDRIFTTRTISRMSGSPHAVYDLPAAPIDLAAFSYTYAGRSYSLAEFAERNRVAGLLMIKAGRVLHESYRFGHTRDTRWTSFSIAKSITSMLIGAAVRDGYIGSLDEPVATYIPELRGSVYDGVTVRHLLQMSSGVQWNEDYSDPQGDVARVGTVLREGGIPAFTEFMTGHPRVAAPGTVFRYNTGETDLLGILLKNATHQDLSTYLSQKVWSQFAMEADAFWVVTTDGLEVAACCLSATLRDFGRFGIFAMRGGTLADGTRIVPDDWLQRSITASPASADYGYLWWLFPTNNFAAIGVFGQSIHLFPQDELVVVMQSFWPADGGPEYAAHRSAFLSALRVTLTQ